MSFTFSFEFVKVLVPFLYGHVVTVLYLGTLPLEKKKLFFY